MILPSEYGYSTEADRSSLRRTAGTPLWTSFYLEATAAQNFEASQRVPSPRRQKSVWESL